MIDLGLYNGVKAMWQQDILHDFTIQVEEREFRVHRVVLAATSQFFWAMFGQGFMESRKDKVDLQGQQPDIVSKLLEFVYTGEEAAILGHEADVLHCSMYLQMPLLSEFCVRKLLEGLTVNNCQTILSTLTDYSFHEGVKKVKDFIKANWKTLISTPLADLSCAALEVITECWDYSEWEMFMHIECWAGIDCIDYDRWCAANQLLSKVRYGLIDPQKLNTIFDTNIFFIPEGSWQELVKNAARFHQMPINLKVLDTSEQTRMKTKPSPVFFTIGRHEPASTFFTLDEENNWKKLKNKMQNVPTFKRCQKPEVLAVNNYFVVCTTCDADQQWYVFDPRTMTWSQITGMARPRRKFALVHHDEHLYVLGGEHISKYVGDYGGGCTKVQRYSFLTNSWYQYGNMPYPVTQHAACVLADNIYCSGGATQHSQKSNKLLSLRLPASQYKTWHEKAACLEELANHKMCTMTINQEDVLVIIDQGFEVTYYSPTRDQWLQFDVTVKLPVDVPDFGLDEMLLTGHNSVFMLNFDGFELGGEGAGAKKHGVCWEWKIPENTVRAVADCPVTLHGDLGPRVCPFGAVLAIPSDIN